MSTEKPLLYLVPVYIGSLKYYEKLIPRLSEEYTVRFLVVRPPDRRRMQMTEYCDTQGHSYDIIETGLTPPRVRIPIATSLVSRWRYQRACRSFLKKHPGTKLVATRTVSIFETLFREANYAGHETIVLQVALTPPPNFYSDSMPSERTVPFLKQLYFSFMKRAIPFADFVSHGARYARTSAHPQKVGVINEAAAQIFAEQFGYDPATIAVVGNADYQRVHELKERIDADKKYRAQLCAKYDLSKERRQILILSSWYEHYIAPKQVHTTDEIAEQVAYFRQVIEAVRDVFSPTEADVLFKLHPSEANIYESYQSLGVKLYGDEALSEELVCMSDLYIADPCTSANYMVVASEVPAIFFNATPLKALNKCTLFFPIEGVENSWEGLTSRLIQFKEGTIPLGYRSESIDVRSIDRIVAFIG